MIKSNDLTKKYDFVTFCPFFLQIGIRLVKGAGKVAFYAKRYTEIERCPFSPKSLYK